MDPRAYILSRTAGPAVDPQADLKRYLRQRLLGADTFGVDRGPASVQDPAGGDAIDAPMITDVPGVDQAALSPAEAAAARGQKILGDNPIVVDGSPTLDNLPREEKGSGQSRSLKLKNDQEHNRKLSLNLPMDPNDVKHAMEVFTGNGDDEPGVKAYQDQEKGIQDLQDTLRAHVETSHPQVDITPAMALVDQWTGSKLAPSYKAPETADAQKARILNAQSKLQDDRRDLFKSLVSTVTAQKGGGNYFTGDAVKAALEAQAQAQDPNKYLPKPAKPGANFGKFLSAIDRDPEVKEYLGTKEALSTARTLITAGNPAADKMFVFKLLRAMGDVRMTGQDKAGAQNIGGLGDRFDQLLEQLQTGEYDPKNRANYIKLLDSIDQARDARLPEIRARAGMMAQGLALSPDEQDLGLRSKLPLKPKAPAAAPTSTMTPAQKKARLEELRKKAGIK